MNQHMLHDNKLNFIFKSCFLLHSSVMLVETIQLDTSTLVLISNICHQLADHTCEWCALRAQGWPTHKEVLEVKKGQELVVTTDETAVASSTRLPISYPHFAHMCQAGDHLFVGRYLVNGADQSSLYLEVCSRQPSVLLR